MSRPKETKNTVIRNTKIPNTYKNLFFKDILVSFNADDCLLWVGTKRAGYGRFRVNGKAVSAHRFSYIYFKSHIPENKIILHICDNRACVNPDHLRIGTYLDNNKDRDLKNRFTVLDGEKNGMAKLKTEDVKKIKSALEAGERGIDLARQYKISPSTISKINVNKYWRNI